MSDVEIPLKLAKYKLNKLNSEKIENLVEIEGEHIYNHKICQIGKWITLD